MTKTYAVTLPVLFFWLVGWIASTWGAVQDDALIHLRYAENLHLHHFITFDGLHPNYGASSLLYVSLLAVLRGLTSSADLPRAASSAAHLPLFAGLALGFSLKIKSSRKVARMAGLVLLLMVCLPSAVRWLDDGMETGIVVCIASSFAWLLHAEVVRIELGREHATLGRNLGFALLSFVAVLLRVELLILCATGFFILTLTETMAPRSARVSDRMRLHRFGSALVKASAIPVGSLLAAGVIRWTMHEFLPDTAVAKSHGIGHWFSPIHDTAITLGGAFSFGIGMLLFWLLTIALVRLSSGPLGMTTVLANCICPLVLAISILRGQEIQGARYFAWTFFFSAVWNILELARDRNTSQSPDSGRWSVPLLYAFLALIAVQLPFETTAMYRVLTHRSETMRTFASEHLDVLRARRGVASDIGYIGYFSKAEICDLAGLVNGRAAAHLGGVERAQACLATKPDFIFANLGQIEPLARMTDLSGWKVCGRYNFANVRTTDSHYLIVRPSIASEVCRATEQSPQAFGTLFPVNVAQSGAASAPL